MNDFLSSYNLADKEYLASLLSPVVKRGSADETAAALLERYGTIENLLCAPTDELCELIGEVAAAAVKTIAAVTSRRVTSAFRFGRAYTRTEISDYFKALFIGRCVEEVYVMSFDAEGGVLACDMVGSGTVNISEVLPRKILESVRRARASAAVIAHNHPSGNTTPSADDVTLTSTVDRILERAGVRLLYHCIVSGQYCSILTTNDL